MVRYSVEQRVFLYEPYVKSISARKCERKFRRKFPGIPVSSTTGIHELINKVRATGSLLDKKPANKRLVLTEEELELGDRLEHTPTKSLRCLAEETSISKSPVAKATKLLKLGPYEATLVCALQPRDPASRNYF
jgi:hypothetical protein